MVMAVINFVLLAASDAFLLLLVLAGVREREYRAAAISFLILLVNSSLWAAFLVFAHVPVIFSVNLAVVAALFCFIFISLLTFFPQREERDTSNIQRYDERDNMFARNNLKYHPELAARYYDSHPEKRATDRKIHEKPGLGEPGAAYYDPLVSPVFDAAFTYLSRTRFAAVGETPKEKKKIDKEKISEIIAAVARFYGAVDVGITPLRAYHFYSHAGRHSKNWGEPIESSHRWAVVIAAAMDIAMIKQAPALPVILESSRQYVECAKIAHIIAQYLRGFGCDARSHSDGNYQVLCVPLAVDAGLGELSRMGIFLHPVFGPCVRLSVVTTEVELAPTHKEKSAYRIEEFCRVCKKCADNCPSKAIPTGEEPSSRGVRHWSIDQERCFSLWKSMGTDCAFCISVCPYTKPDTLVHKLVRFYISRSSLNQRIALFFDDLLYGRKKPLRQNNPECFL